MKRTFTIAISLVIFLLTSCISLTEKHNKTTDLTTGGFTDIRFDLNTDNTLNLIKIDQRAISQNDSGTIYKPETLSVAGTWEVFKGNLRCDIKESEEFIREAFFKSALKTKDITQNYNEIIFQATTDTIYIFGQPCIATKTTNR